jgi:hypothetical protein
LLLAVKMKSVLIFASLIAVGLAYVVPEIGGPAPLPPLEPIAIGPAPLPPFEPVAVGPPVLEYEAISNDPAIVEEAPVPDAIYLPTPVVQPSASSPLVQIIVNVVQADQLPAIKPEPVNIVENAEDEIAPSPVIIVDEAVPVPVGIGQPELIMPIPVPVAINPEILN